METNPLVIVYEPQMPVSKRISRLKGIDGPIPVSMFLKGKIETPKGFKSPYLLKGRQYDPGRGCPQGRASRKDRLPANKEKSSLNRLQIETNLTVGNMSVEEAKFRIEHMLGWKEGESDVLSLRALQALVRGTDPRFDKALSLLIESGGHLFVPYQKPRHYDY